MSERTPIVEHDGMPHYEDINTPLIFMLTIIAAIVTYACVAAITGLFHQMKKEQQAMINAETVTMSAQFIAQQKEDINKGDAEQNIVPIQDAMQSTIAELGGQWQSETADHTDHDHTDHDNHEPPAGEQKTGADNEARDSEKSEEDTAH